ncbi:SGNH/GDSL hydrolase family protein [Meiothermus sp.]|uniref:SGNH/GDSL hydrolase family protein n=1 Tax=Meiothermus sp. TaxID=1955249 RepID=UPI00307E5F8C
MIRCFVALGDSFTEGVGDTPGPSGYLPRQTPEIPLYSAHHWLALWMRGANPSLKYTNLAERGLRVAEVRAQQMQRALNLQPDFVSIVAGANDCLRGPFSTERVRAELELMLGAFQSIGARIFTATLPNFTLHLDLPGGFRQRLERNLEATNRIIRELAAQNPSVDRVYPLELVDKDGVIHASFEKTLYIRRKDAKRSEKPDKGV